MHDPYEKPFAIVNGVELTKGEWQAGNLSLLADYLEHNVKDEQFDMADMRQSLDSSGNRYPATFRNRHNCGTIGCVLGWAPFVPELDYTDDEYLGTTLDWNAYAERLFVEDTDSAEWDWLFSEWWEERDNTRMGAVKRIRDYVCYGLPKSWEAQLRGSVPLEYLTK